VAKNISSGVIEKRRGGDGRQWRGKKHRGMVALRISPSRLCAYGAFIGAHRAWRARHSGEGGATAAKAAAKANGGIWQPGVSVSWRRHHLYEAYQLAIALMAKLGSGAAASLLIESW
jgi:hypothetical protein